LIDQPVDKPRRETITGVVLAGGRARRMGGQDKGLAPFAGRPLVEWVLAALAPQVGTLLINANRNQETYGSLGHPVIEDRIEGFQGPLAGFASAMAAVSTPWVVTVPCDGPFLAPDLVQRLCAALEREGAEIAVATDGARMQPVYALLPVVLAPSLQDFLAEGERKIDLWYARHRVALADLSDRPESFANINSEADSARLERGAAP
jgi:molybdopterin-guanine dinucleotide biosynthesis protein A